MSAVAAVWCGGELVYRRCACMYSFDIRTVLCKMDVKPQQWTRIGVRFGERKGGISGDWDVYE